MIEYSHQLTPEKLEYLEQMEPAYSVRLDPLSELAVTPAAHEFYGYQPRVDVLQGRVIPSAAADPRKPYVQLVFAAPTEFSAAKLEEKDLFYSATNGRCLFALTVPQTPDEYVSLGQTDYCQGVRMRDWHTRSDEQILAEMDPATSSAMEAELRAGQIADFINMLSPLLMTRIVHMQEHSFPRDAERQRQLARQGIQMSVLSDSGVESFTALPKVIKYGKRRADDIARQAFRVFCEPEHDFLLRT